MGDATQVRESPAGEAAGGNGRARADGAAWTRLQEQIAWYDARSGHSQRRFKRLKVGQIVIAAAIPVAAGVSAPAWLVGGAGALIVVLESLQQLFQYQQNWSAYRSTCERLKHEQWLYAAAAGPYAGVERPSALLAERVEGLVSQEHAAWAAARRHAEEAER